MNRRIFAEFIRPLSILALLATGLILAGCETIADPKPRAGQAAEGRQTLNFNPAWKFIKDDPQGAQAPEFNDAQWQIVSAPHTYNDTDTFDNWSLLGHRGEQEQWSGRTWYRKTFTLPPSASGKRVVIEFEAVRQVGEVFLNGQRLGIHKSGFSPFGFDLTPHIKDGPNVMAVMVDNRFQVDRGGQARIEQSQRTGNPTGQRDRGPSGGQTGGGSLAQMTEELNRDIPESVDELEGYQIPWNNPHWHPAHGGLYRNVKLHILDPLHISLPLYSFLQTEGPYVYATDITDNSATIGIEIPIENHRPTAANISVIADILDYDGKSVATAKIGGDRVGANDTTLNKVKCVIPDPKRWEPSYPYLYTVRIQLTENGRTIDSVDVPLGIRTTKWTVEDGFFINGNHLKLHGWGQKSTNEWPGLGAAQPDWLQYFTIDLMKESGGNIVRWGHTAGGPSQVEAADRLGVITHQPGVDGEGDTVRAAWRLRADTFRDIIVYFRNSPSLLIWEGGNQKVSQEHVEELHALVDKYDPHGGRVFTFRRPGPIVAPFMDIQIGTEGGRDLPRTFPLPVVEGEYNREESPRRVWDRATPRWEDGDKSKPPVFGYHGRGSYPNLDSEKFAVNQVQQYFDKLGPREHSGGANWIFSDSTSGGRVETEVARASGEVDGVRLPKEAFYVTQAMFVGEPKAHIIGHWNYPAGTSKTMYVASNTDRVELFVNGKSLGDGKQSLRYLFEWPAVQFAPGEVKAVGYRDGQAAAGQTKRTTGEAVALKLTPFLGPDGFQANGSDVALFDVEAVDARGERVPTVEQRVDFEVSGPAIWRGGYNSGKIDSINNSFLNIEAGVNRVALRSTLEAGDVTLVAKSAGLAPATAKIQARAFEVVDGYSRKLPAMPTPKLADGPTPEVDTLGQGAGGPSTSSGTFINAFSYSGPSKGARVQTQARGGEAAYAEGGPNLPATLPAELRGADFTLVANADRLYNAVDLMEISAAAGTVIYVAHDDSLARPEWLTRQFEPTDLKIAVGRRPMSLFRRNSTQTSSITLGANTEDTNARGPNMYLVFVNAAPH